MLLFFFVAADDTGAANDRPTTIRRPSENAPTTVVKNPDLGKYMKASLGADGIRKENFGVQKSILDTQKCLDRRPKKFFGCRKKDWTTKSFFWTSKKCFLDVEKKMEVQKRFGRQKHFLDDPKNVLDTT